MKHIYTLMIVIVMMSMAISCEIFTDSDSPPTFSISPIRAGKYSTLTVKASETVGLEKPRAELPDYFILEYAESAFTTPTRITVTNVDFALSTFTLAFAEQTFTAGSEIRVTIKAGIVSDLSDDLNPQVALTVRVE